MTVDKNQFLSLVKRYNASSSEEAQNVLNFRTQYPYSQLLRVLAARVSKDHALAGEQSDLQAAAVFSADRSVLKDIISAEGSGFINRSEKEYIAASTSTESAPVAVVVTPEPQKISKPEVVISPPRLTPLTVDSELDVADEVMRDLEKLNSLRHNFEMMFVEYAEVVPEKTQKEKPSAKEKETIKEEKETEAVKDKEAPKSRKERIIELAKAAQNREPEETHVKEGKTKKSDGKMNASEQLITEIITNKEEITPDTPKQKEQIDIINHFIKVQPSITSAKDRQPTQAADLNPVKTGEFGDNIISETLVEILLKQGKKDKAIEVLKKLIWKYPQKKAYFASQIEDLKK